MKNLKDSMKKLQDKYVSVEALSETEKHNTYGGASILIGGDEGPGTIRLCYGVPPWIGKPIEK